MRRAKDVPEAVDAADHVSRIEEQIAIVMSEGVGALGIVSERLGRLQAEGYAHWRKIGIGLMKKLLQCALRRITNEPKQKQMVT